MQPERQTDDLHSIMSRFTSWAGKQAGSGLAGAGEGVREIPYEEAMERLRSRRRMAPAPVAVPAHAADLAMSAERGEPVESAASFAASVDTERAVPAIQMACEQPAVKSAHRVRAAVRGTAAAAKPGKAGVAERRSGKQSGKTKTPEFRQVLAKSVASSCSGAPGKAAKAGKIERGQRVSVRLSSEEERELQQRAAEAGTTVSQYLRQCALPARAERNGGMIAEDPPAQTSRLQSAAAAKPSGLGEWITLLRNRFLSSPARFAERA